MYSEMIGMKGLVRKSQCLLEESVVEDSKWVGIVFEEAMPEERPNPRKGLSSNVNDTKVISEE